MSEITLFGFPRSVYVQMAGLVLTHKEVPYKFHDLEQEMGGPTHLALHPFDRVPILRHGDFTLYETSAIAAYIDEAFDGPKLTPGDPQQRGRMNQWISAVNAYYYQVLERELSGGKAFLLGLQLTLADFYMLPIIHAFGFTPEAQAMYPKFPSICTWRERMEALPTLKRFRAAQPPRGPIEHARSFGRRRSAELDHVAELLREQRELQWRGRSIGGIIPTTHVNKLTSAGGRIAL